MITTEIYTITDLLYTPALRCNQSKLALLLKISRVTLRKYMDDTNNERHSIFVVDGKYRFHCKPGSKHSGDKTNVNTNTSMA